MNRSELALFLDPVRLYRSQWAGRLHQLYLTWQKILDSIYRAYSLFISERFPLPLEEQVAKLEQRLGTKLPANYRNFVLMYNGGYFTEPNIVAANSPEFGDKLTYISGISASHPSAELGSKTDLSLFRDNNPVKYCLSDTL